MCNNMHKLIYSPYYQVEVPIDGGLIIEDIPKLVRGNLKNAFIRRGKFVLRIANNRILMISPRPRWIYIWYPDKNIIEKLYSNGKKEIINVHKLVNEYEDEIIRIRRKSKKEDKWKVIITKYMVQETIINIANIITFRDKKRWKISETILKWKDAIKLGIIDQKGRIIRRGI